MTFAYLILAHRNPTQLKRLIKALDCEGCIIIIHLDSDSPKCLFSVDFDNIFKAKIYFTEYRKKVSWGRYSMIEATMSLVAFYFKLRVKVDYIHLLSGQDYPVKSQDEMQQFFSNYKGKSFLEYFSLPDTRWKNSLNRIKYRWGVNEYENGMYSNLEYASNYDKIRELPESITPYGGSQWWSMYYDCLLYVYDEYIKGNSLFDFYRFSYIPDEMLFQTILMNSRFSNSIVNDNLRYIKWKAKSSHPECINNEDVANFKFENKFFARKFEFYNDVVLNKLDNIIGNKNYSIYNDLKFCIISAVGRQSLHRSWLKDLDERIDLHLIVYDDSYDKYQLDTPFVTTGKGQKLQLIYQYLKSNKSLIYDYSYFFFPDDDIQMDATTIFRLFKMMNEYQLLIAQPALEYSFYSYAMTLKQPDKILRFTNFVEMMVPCFSRDALKKVLFTFHENKSGWGVDYHWAKLVGKDDYSIAIIDDVSVIHTRPVQSKSDDNIREMSEYLRKYNLSRTIWQYS